MVYVSNDRDVAHPVLVSHGDLDISCCEVLRFTISARQQGTCKEEVAFRSAVRESHSETRVDSA